jgi:hypothetical protein
MIVFFALMALACLVQAGRYGYLWARPRGALYPAWHFPSRILPCLIVAGLLVALAVTW